MIAQQKKLVLSQYSELYDILVPADHFLRRLHDDIDFSFIYRELVVNYSENMGRMAYDPVMMFKYLILKVISNLSDVDLVNEVRVNMAYKYFLDMAPEELPVDDTTLCKFRKTRLKNTNLIDLLLAKTFEMAEAKGIIKRSDDDKIHLNAIIDGTHTVSAASYYLPVPALKEWSKKLRYQLYTFLPETKGVVENDKCIRITDLEGELAYCHRLIDFVNKRMGGGVEFPRLRKVLNRFKEMAEDIIDHYSYSRDPDARLGHKNLYTDFYGYKSHIIIDKNSELIFAVLVTSGEKGDAIPGLEVICNLLKKKDFKIDEVIGDAAYSGKPILELANENSFEILAPPHPNLGFGIDGRDGFTFNKDADMFICPKGHLAVRKRIISYKKDNFRKAISYAFDTAKCSVCSIKETCLKNAKTKTFTVSHLSPAQIRLLEYSQTQEFKDRRRERYKIEAKNAHIKQGLGYGKAMFYGIEMMTVQCAVTMFVSNLKKIYTKMP